MEVVLITTVYRLKYETENNELLKFFMWWNEREPQAARDDDDLFNGRPAAAEDIDHRNLISERGIMFMLML